MSIQFINDLGRITISNSIIEDAVSEFCQEPGLYDRIWLAAKPDVSAMIDESGSLIIKYSVYVRFGQSIKEITRKLSDKLVEFLQEKTGVSTSFVTVNVSGVRSQHLVKRNMDIEIDYRND